MIRSPAALVAATIAFSSAMTSLANPERRELLRPGQLPRPHWNPKLGFNRFPIEGREALRPGQPRPYWNPLWGSNKVAVHSREPVVLRPGETHQGLWNPAWGVSKIPVHRPQFIDGKTPLPRSQQAIVLRELIQAAMDDLD